MVVSRVSWMLLVDPPQVLPGIDEAGEHLAEEAGRPGHHPGTEPLGGGERRGQVVHVDLQQARQVRPAGLAVREHQHGVADRQFGVEQEAVVVDRTRVGVLRAAEHLSYELHQSVGITGDQEGVDG